MWKTDTSASFTNARCCCFFTHYAQCKEDQKMSTKVNDILYIKHYTFKHSVVFFFKYMWSLIPKQWDFLVQMRPSVWMSGINTMLRMSWNSFGIFFRISLAFSLESLHVFSEMILHLGETGFLAPSLAKATEKRLHCAPSSLHCGDSENVDHLCEPEYSSS